MGCITREERGEPLYAERPRPNRAQIARLSGYVRKVDGKTVALRAKTFELLPGCHLVQTPTTWGHFDPHAGGVLVTTPALAFALPMKPGHSYSVRVDVRHSTGPMGFAEVRAEERDAGGELTRTFVPLRSPDESCREEGRSAVRPSP